MSIFIVLIGLLLGFVGCGPRSTPVYVPPVDATGVYEGKLELKDGSLQDVSINVAPYSTDLYDAVITDLATGESTGYSCYTFDMTLDCSYQETYESDFIIIRGEISDKGWTGTRTASPPDYSEATETTFELTRAEE